MREEQRRWIPDPMYDSGGLVRVMPDSLSTGRHGPWVLAGVPGGEVRITNGWLPPGALRLWRFANLGQAGCAAAVIRRHARLSDDGWAWEVADVADHRPIHDIAGQLAALRAWARSLEPEIEAALIGRGPGHYPLLERTQGDA